MARRVGVAQSGGRGKKDGCAEGAQRTDFMIPPLAIHPFLSWLNIPEVSPFHTMRALSFLLTYMFLDCVFISMLFLGKVYQSCDFKGQLSCKEPSALNLIWGGVVNLADTNKSSMFSVYL